MCRSTTTEQAPMVHQGLRCIVKNTFLDFDDKAECYRSLRRSRSCPAAIGSRNENSESTSSRALVDTPSSDWDGVTSLMIKNIPCSCSREDVLNAVEKFGFGNAHNFFYCPVRRSKTIGYAFIGFPDEQSARGFAQSMSGYLFDQKSSTKVVAIVPARIQGFKETIAHFKNTSTIRNQGQKMFRSKGSERKHA